MELMQTPIDVTGIERCIDVAESIGFHLARTALWNGDMCNWVGSAADMVNGSFQLVEKAFDADVYNGTAGIALFLSLLLEQRHDDIISETLKGAVNHMIKNCGNEQLGNYGYFGGSLGVGIGGRSCGCRRGVLAR